MENSDTNNYEMVESKGGDQQPVQMRNGEPDVEKAFTTSSGPSSKYHTAPPSYFDKIKKSFRDKLHSSRDDDHSFDVVQRISDELCPVDFSDSFDTEEQLAVRIGRDSVKFSIQEMMRDLRSDSRVLSEIEDGNNNIKLNNLSCEERQVVMLWAAFLRRKDIIERLLAKKDCDLQISTPADGLSALHLAAYSGCHECVNLLLGAGAKITHLQTYSPLHCAALSASLNCVNMLLQNGAKVDTRSETVAEELQDTPLHCAIKANSTDCVKRLLKAGADPSALGQGGLTPLHVAGDLAYLGCMRALLDFRVASIGKSFDINQKTRDGRGYTTLHLVTEDQFADGIRLLKEYGVSCKVKSEKGMTPLHLACREQSVECAKLLIDDSDVNEEDGEKRTPLHLALGRSEAAEITEFLVNSHQGIKVNKADKYGFTPLHVAAVNEQAQAAAILIRAGADLTARTDKGSTALRMVIRKVPTALYAVEEVMDSSVSLTNNMDSRDVELKLDFKPLLASKKRITTDLLNTFIAEGHPELMQHPLCQAFLHLKWQEVRIFYILRLLYYFIFLCSISVYVVAFLSNECTEELLADDYGKPPETCDAPISFEAYESYLRWIHEAMIWIAIFEGIRKLYGLIAFCIAPTSVSIRSSIYIYLWQLDNWLEWICLVFVAIVASVDRGSWHVYVGALAVLAGWSNLMILIGQLPYFGAYVAMYTCVLREMAKLLMAYFCMLIGFAVSFHVVFRKKEGFSNFWKTIVKILVMMTGELEFNDLFEEGNSTDKTVDPLEKHWNIRLGRIHNELKPSREPVEAANVEIFAYIIFTIFLLLVTVVLMNLLVGIAVNDIHGLRTSAVISRLQRQADLIGYIETALPNCTNIRCFLFCCFCCLPLFNRKSTARNRRLRTQVGVLSVQPHNMKTNSLPREIVSAAFEVAKRMNPYKGNLKKSTKPTPRYKRIYSKQHSGSMYDSIIPRGETTKRPSIPFSRCSQYLNLEKLVDNNYDSRSEQSDASNRNVMEEIKDLKEALAQQTALLQQILESNQLKTATLKPPLSEC